LSLSSSTALLLCHRLFLLPFNVSVSFSSHLHGDEKLTSSCHPVLHTYPSFYFKKKTGILINDRLGYNNSHYASSCTQPSDLDSNCHSFNSSSLKLNSSKLNGARLGIQYYKIKNMLGNVNRQ